MELKKQVLIGAATFALIGAASGAALARSDSEWGGRHGGFAAMFEQADANGDGAVTRAEMDALRATRRTAADANGDGALDRAEFEAMLDARRKAHREARITTMFQRMDVDGDGRIEVNETSHAHDMFARIDANGDGVVSKAEARAGARRMMGYDHGKGDCPGQGGGSAN